MDKAMILALYPVVVIFVAMWWIALLVLRKKDVNITLNFLGMKFSFTTCAAGNDALCPLRKQG